MYLPGSHWDCLPWRRIRSWACLACGECCQRFRPVLSAYEYALFLRKFGSGVIEIDSLGNPHLRHVRGRCTFLNSKNLCQLQPLGMKPWVCKLWPFKVSNKLDPRAEFRYEGREYHIFVDPSCRGVNKGDPQRLPATISEIIDIYHDPSTEQRYSTSTGLGIPLIQPKE